MDPPTNPETDDEVRRRLGETVRDQTPDLTRDTTFDHAPASGATPELASPGSAALLDPGEEGSRYLIGRLLGRGGGGLVFSVTDRHVRRDVALKVLPPRQAEDERRQVRLISEARITASLEHPNILPIFDVDRGPDGRCYFTMRLAKAASLQDHIDRWQRGEPSPAIATVAERIEILIKVCDALAFAHHQGVLHRDVKPANILVGEFGEVLLVDWGSATSEEAARQDRRLTGTPLFMAPEQARAEGCDRRADLYALGATLHHLLTGKDLLATQVPVEEFWRTKQLGEVTIAELPKEAEDLSGLLESALSADPDQRPAGIEAFGAELRAWQRHRDSRAISNRAEELSRDLERKGDHAGWARVGEDFRHALELWSGNRRAAEGLALARFAHARHALAVGDLDLAASLLSPELAEQAELLAEVERARAARRNQSQRTRRWRLAASAAAILAVIGVIGLVINHLNTLGAWVTVVDAEAADLADRLESTYADVNRPEEPLVADGQGLRLIPGRLAWLSGVAERGDVRVTVRGRWTGKVDGFEIHLRTGRASPPRAWSNPVGLTCQFGGHVGRDTFLNVVRVAGLDQVVVLDSPAFDPDRTYELSLSIEEGLFTMSVDGRPLLSYHLVLPLSDADLSWVALRTWSPFVCEHLTVERRALPLRTSPLVSGDALLAAGHRVDALRTYLSLADDFVGSQVEEDALARAFLTACLEPELALRRAPILARLEKAFPESSQLDGCREAEAVQAWREGEITRALDLAEGLLASDPRRRIAVDLIGIRHPDPPERSQIQRLLGLIAKSQGVSRLDLQGLEIVDLSPLQGLSLETLSLEANPIVDLSPLAGMPLSVLRMNDCPVADLSPLAGMPLRQLFAANTRITDLAPLRGAPLETLSCPGTGVTDLTPVWTSIIRDVTVSRCPIERLPQGATGLERLRVEGTSLTDLSPLATSALTSLNLQNCPISDLAPLSGRPLEELIANGTRVVDLRPLQGVPLKRLHLNGTSVADLTPLAGSGIEYLQLAETRVSDLSPLLGLPLKDLKLDGCPVTNLAPLAGMSLTHVGLANVAVSDLSPLMNPSLRSLEIAGVEGLDLSPLARASLKSLQLEVPGRVDLTPLLVGRPIAVIDLRGTGTAADLMALLAAWERKRASGQILHQLRVQIALRSNDSDALRATAIRLIDREVVALPDRVTLPEAKELARKHQARLLTLPTRAHQVEFRDHLLVENTAWLGLGFDEAGSLRWGDGSPCPLAWTQARIRVSALYGSLGFYFLEKDSDRPFIPVVGPGRVTARVFLEWPVEP